MDYQFENDRSVDQVAIINFAPLHFQTIQCDCCDSFKRWRM